MRAFESDADAEGDWAIYCHKSHHIMKPTGHSVRTYIGVDQAEIARKVGQLVPGFMPVTTPPAEAGGFSVQLRGNPPAYAPKADIPARSEGPFMHNHRRRHVAIQHAPAGAGMYSNAERLGLDRPALGAGLARSARVLPAWRPAAGPGATPP